MRGAGANHPAVRRTTSGKRKRRLKRHEARHVNRAKNADLERMLALKELTEICNG